MKSDMITLGELRIEIGGAGYFSTDWDWIHPERMEKSYELIYVTEGTIYLEDSSKKLTLSKNDLIILRPGIIHRGFRLSTGRTSFYWLHLIFDNPPELPYIINEFSGDYLFRELLHYIDFPKSNDTLKAGILMHLLGLIITENEQHSIPNGKLSHEIIEWISINADAQLTVKKVAQHFGYNPEYLTRIIKNSFNTGIKAIIDDYVIKKANDYLLNTNYSIKEIAALLKFQDANLFTNFYKYHEHTVPLKYRNSYSEIRKQE